MKKKNKKIDKYLFDDNISDKLTKDSFGVKCKVCDSENVQITYRNRVVSQGSEYTGSWTSTDMGLLFKCCDCGNAIAITDEYLPETTEDVE